jgi:HK97 family phage prohead protease
MAMKVNSKGKSNCKNLIGSGKVDKTSSWSFVADDGNKILGDPPDWKAYGKWFMAVDDSADPETKDHYHYPFGKNGKVYRSALIAIRQRAGQQKATDIYNAAGMMLDMIDNKKSIDQGIERRFIPISELRATKDGDTPKIVGHAAVFNKWSEDLGGFREQIKPGAFKKVIKESDTRMLWNHDSNYVLGRVSAGTLTLKEDKDGLSVDNTPPDTQWARDLMVSIDRGDVNQMSFGFRVEKDEWFEDKDGNITRTILEMRELPDVSPVTFPAYPQTDLALRSLENWKSEKDRQEQEQRDADEAARQAAADAAAAEQKRLQEEASEAERIRVSDLRRKQLALKEREMSD